jgi:hypothetical protein
LEGVEPPIETEEGTFLNAPLAKRVHRFLVEAELYPAAAARALEAQRRIDDERLRQVVEIMDAEAERRAAEAVQEAGGIPTWTAIFWAVGALAVGFGAGVMLGLAVR